MKKVDIIGLHWYGNKCVAEIEAFSNLHKSKLVRDERICRTKITTKGAQTFEIRYFSLIKQFWHLTKNTFLNDTLGKWRQFMLKRNELSTLITFSFSCIKRFLGKAGELFCVF